MPNEEGLKVSQARLWKLVEERVSRARIWRRSIGEFGTCSGRVGDHVHGSVRLLAQGRWNSASFTSCRSFTSSENCCYRSWESHDGLLIKEEGDSFLILFSPRRARLRVRARHAARDEHLQSAAQARRADLALRRHRLWRRAPIGDSDVWGREVNARASSAKTPPSPVRSWSRSRSRRSRWRQVDSLRRHRSRLQRRRAQLSRRRDDLSGVPQTQLIARTPDALHVVCAPHEQPRATVPRWAEGELEADEVSECEKQRYSEHRRRVVPLSRQTISSARFSSMP